MGRRESLSILLTLLFFVFVSIEGVSAVDKSKFKTCEQSGFCTRNRALSDSQLLSPYTLDGIEAVGNTDSSLKGTIRDDLDQDSTEKSPPRFSLEVITYAKEIVRIRVTEREPLVPRYEPADVLLPDIQQVAFKHFDHTSATLGFSVGFGEGKELKVSKAGEPLKFEFYLDGELAISANDRGLFSFEHTRAKATTEGANNNRQLLQEGSNEEEGAAGEEGEGGALTEEQAKELEAELENIDDEAVRERKASEWNEKGERRVDHLSAPHDLQQAGEEEGTEGGQQRHLLQENSLYKRVNSDMKGWEETFSSHRDPKQHGPQSVGLDFTFHGTQYLYGIPEHASSLMLKDTKNTYREPYRLYNLDVFEYELDVPMALYGAVPLILSINEKRSTGVFWLNPTETWIDVSLQGEHSSTHWMSESGIIDFFVFLGSKPHDLFPQYASLTGTNPVPQLSSIAYHQCRWNYKDQTDVAAVDAGFDEHDIPYDFIWLDIEHTNEKRYFTWDQRYFPDPIDMINKIAAKGRKMVTIIDPHIKRDSGFHLHSEAHEKGYYVKKNSQDSSDYEGWCWPGSSSWLDYLNPVVRDYWSNKFQYDSYIGSNQHLFTWNDMNEPSVFNGPEVTMHKDAYHYGGFEHRDVHNIYGFYQHLSTFNGHLYRSNFTQRPFVLTRAFFSGSQRYSAVWTGDNEAEWSHLAIAQPMLLSLSISGIVFCGADVGGFFKNPEPQLMLRWYQAGIFHPFFRAHAHLETKRREPWLFGEPWTSQIRDIIRIRYSLLPLWYTLFQESSISGVPIMRPLWVEFPADQETYAIDNAFLVGDALLVKPVVFKDAVEQQVYFPGNTGNVWYDFFDFTVHLGGVTKHIDAPLSKVPVFIRGGSILPKKDRARRSSVPMAHDPYSFVVALDLNGKAKGRLYVDDGSSYSYKNGAYLETVYSFENNQLSSSVLHYKQEGHFSVSNVVERITVVGLKKSPSAVILMEKGEGRKLEFSYQVEKDVVVVRKPEPSIAGEWTLSFEF